jgi:hypothetical protein
MACCELAGEPNLALQQAPAAAALSGNIEVTLGGRLVPGTPYLILDERPRIR